VNCERSSAGNDAGRVKRENGRKIAREVLENESAGLGGAVSSENDVFIR
jgi:hypothetical protein